MTTAGVRPARVSDATQIARVTLAAWTAAEALPADVLAQVSPDELEMSWTQSLLNPPTPTHALLVAHEDDRILGYALVGPGTDPQGMAIEGIGELLDLVVDPDAQRQGHGSRLMMAAADITRAAGWNTWVTWCPVDDEIRRAFLASAGWGPDGAFRDLAIDAERTMRQVRLVTDLSEDQTRTSRA